MVMNLMMKNDYGLHLLNKIPMRSGKTLGDFPHMTLPQGPMDGHTWEDIFYWPSN